MTNGHGLLIMSFFFLSNICGYYSHALVFEIIGNLWEESRDVVFFERVKSQWFERRLVLVINRDFVVSHLSSLDLLSTCLNRLFLFFLHVLRLLNLRMNSVDFFCTFNLFLYALFRSVRCCLVTSRERFFFFLIVYHSCLFIREITLLKRLLQLNLQSHNSGLKAILNGLHGRSFLHKLDCQILDNTFSTTGELFEVTAMLSIHVLGHRILPAKKLDLISRQH